MKRKVKDGSAAILERIINNPSLPGFVPERTRFLQFFFFLFSSPLPPSSFFSELAREKLCLAKGFARKPELIDAALQPTRSAGVSNWLSGGTTGTYEDSAAAKKVSARVNVAVRRGKYWHMIYGYKYWRSLVSTAARIVESGCQETPRFLFFPPLLFPSTKFS